MGPETVYYLMTAARDFGPLPRPPAGLDPELVCAALPGAVEEAVVVIRVAGPGPVEAVVTAPLIPVTNSLAASLA